MKNKKAVELNITAIIIVILAVLVLLVLTIAFTGGMSKLWAIITGQMPSAGEQEATFIAKCNLYMSTGNTQGFCCDKKKVGTSAVEVSCSEYGASKNWNGFDTGADTFCNSITCQAA